MSDVVQFIPRAEWEATLATEATRDTPLKLPKELNRKRVVSAFMDAFELLGGTTRLVEWANRNDENYTNFVKLYARLMPAQADTLIFEDEKKTILHILPRSRLDE